MKKGDKVWHFTKWDRLGACVYTHYTVMSCGQKQMTLCDDNDTMRKHYVYAQDYRFVVADTPALDPVAQARAFSAEFINDAILYCEQRLQLPAYNHETIRAEMDGLIKADPRALSRDEAVAGVQAAVAAGLF